MAEKRLKRPPRSPHQTTQNLLVRRLVVHTLGSDIYFASRPRSSRSPATLPAGFRIQHIGRRTVLLNEAVDGGEEVESIGPSSAAIDGLALFVSEANPLTKPGGSRQPLLLDASQRY
jgi:hypothetical protein